MLTGAAISMSGLVMQMITQNRFVESTTTGTIEWAGTNLCLSVIPAPTLVQRMTGAIIFLFLNYDFLFFYESKAASL